MKRSMHSLRWFVVCTLALGSFALGCRKEEPAKEPEPALAPPTEQPTETPQQTPEGQPAPTTPAPGYMGGPMQHDGHMMGGQQGMMGERDFCSAVARHANLRLEEVDGGVAIILTPKAGVDPATLRQQGMHMSYELAPPSNQPRSARPQTMGQRCSLFDLGEYSERSGVVQQGDEVRIILIAPSTGDAQSLRDRARVFVQEWQQP